MGTFVLAAEEFTPPGASLFEYPPIFGSVTKPMVLAVLSLVIVVAVFTLGTRKLAIVPSRFQFGLESFYNIPRNTMARDQIGSEDFKPFIPLILGLFSFILVNNLFAIVPVIQFPTMSRIGFPIALAIFVYAFYHYAGFRKHGFAGYIKHAALPPGVPAFIAPLIIVIELLQKFLVQPLSLALRVFAAMFAGHLIIALTAVAAEFLITAGGALTIAGPFAFVAGIAFTFLEALVQVIQAYVFALLAAVFIGAAIAEDH